MSILDLILKPLRAGLQTENYPGTVRTFERGSRGAPVLIPARCSAEKVCVMLCPTNAIQVDVTQGAGTWQIDYGACIFCGRCIDGCPSGAIAASDDFELAVRHREDAVAKLIVRGKV